MSQRQDRADRLLIAIALVILFMAGAAYYFDNWMWGERKDRAARIGNISAKSGDVRVKFEGDLKWGKASRGQDLVYNDSIYAGAGSEAELALGQSQMTVQENTLIVLRRERDVNFLNLDYGTLLGKVAKDEKIMIETGSGKPIELTPTSNAQIVLRKTKQGKTELNVISGKAEITVNGKKQSITNSQKVVLEEQAPVPQPVVETLRLVALTPLNGQTIYSGTPMDIPFRWEWSNKRPAGPSDRFSLEFSAEPAFQKIHARKEVAGRLDSTMHASKSLSLYYRVRGPRGELSQTERVNFVRLEAPLIVKPLADQKFVAPAGTNALIETEFKKAQANVSYQIAADKDFAKVLISESTQETRIVPELGPGSYFMRARHDFGNSRTSEWSPVVPFQVEVKLEPLRLTEVQDGVKVIIPNKAYPAGLYRASSAKVREYLAKKGFLAGHFPMAEGSFDQLKIDIEGLGPAKVQSSTQWPMAAMAPGAYSYKYQASKAGYESTPVIGPKKLEIAMEPPRPVGTADFGAALEDGSRDVSWKFTPLLFAGSYDVEVARDPSFRKADQLKFDSPVARASLNPGPHYWRARARDIKGRVISGYSAPEKFEVPQLATPPALAKTPESPEREPAAIDSSNLKIEEKPAERWVRNGWYLWAGSGYTYADMRQSVPSRGTLTSYGASGGGSYFEGGFNGATGWGGVISYTSTPGKVETKNAVIDRNRYMWSALSVEGYKRALMQMPFTAWPVIYGVRVGIQKHKTPYVFLKADEETDLLLKQNEMDTVSFGLSAEIPRGRWTYYWQNRYQYPFSSTAEGSVRYQIKPTFAFDGVVGTSYSITERMKLGAFFYGQWHQYNFDYGDADVVNSGFQSLFYSSFDLRLGFEF